MDRKRRIQSKPEQTLSARVSASSNCWLLIVVIGLGVMLTGGVSLSLSIAHIRSDWRLAIPLQDSVASEYKAHFRVPDGGSFLLELDVDPRLVTDDALLDATGETSGSPELEIDYYITSKDRQLAIGRSPSRFFTQRSEEDRRIHLGRFSCDSEQWIDIDVIVHQIPPALKAARPNIVATRAEYEELGPMISAAVRRAMGALVLLFGAAVVLFGALRLRRCSVMLLGSNGTRGAC